MTLPVWQGPIIHYGTSTVNSPFLLLMLYLQFVGKYPIPSMSCTMPYHTAACWMPMPEFIWQTGYSQHIAFDNAKVIVSMGADFLGTWISPEINAKQYSKGRKISAKNLMMSKHYQLEGMMSLTGGSADERYTCKPSQYGAIALAF
jgi:hypothetical protein